MNYNYVNTKYTGPSTKTIRNQSDIDSILNTETKRNQEDSWAKLNKTLKLALLNKYADGLVNKYDSIQIDMLKKFLKHNLTVSKLLKVKDIDYDKEKREIVKIIPLMYDNKQFILKRKNKTKKKITS